MFRFGTVVSRMVGVVYSPSGTATAEMEKILKGEKK